MTRYAIALLFFLVGSVAQAQFIIYREFFFSGQPAESYFDNLGLKRSHGVYEAEVTGGTPPVKQSLMISTAQRTASNYQLHQNRMWYDIEYLSCDSFTVGKTQALKNADSLAKYIHWAKQSAAGLEIGMYSIVPVADPYIHTRLAQRQSANDLIQRLADSLSFICPSIYLFYGESTLPYANYAAPMVQEARRMAKGKKVFAFVAPGYHDAGDHDGLYASKAVWANVLNTIKNAGADGVIIFGGVGAMGTQPSNWSYIDTCGWWQATKEFLAANNGGSGTTPPAAPSLIAPVQGSVITPPSMTARWGKVSGATGYHFQLSTTSTFTSLIVDDANLVDTLRQVSSLADGTTYYVRVRAKNASGWGSYSGTDQFSTTSSVSPAPAAPTVISPVAGQVISPLGWTAVWRKAAGAVKYQFQLSNSSSFSSTLISDSTRTDTTRGMGNLAYSTTYYIRVRSKGAASWGSYSGTVVFSTEVAPPSIVYPPSGTKHGGTSIRSRWNKISGASEYELQIAMSSTFAATEFDDPAISDTAKDVTLANGSAQYYCRVRAMVGSGWTQWSPVSDFATVSSSSAEEEQGLPTVFSLAQNYPNPFNPSTTIRFSLPVGGHVRLTVYDNLGQVVKALVDDHRDAGSHEVRLDGARMASGIYYYRIEAGAFVSTKKLVLLK